MLHWTGSLQFRALAIASVAGLFLAGQAQEEKPPEKAARVAIAIVVHPNSKVSDLSLRELRAILKLEKQFWPEGKRVLLFQRPSKSPEGRVLLETVYNLTEEELRKAWVQKLFAGEIPAIPAVVRNRDGAITAVKKNEGAITVVLAGEVPEGVRLLAIDGKKPNEAGYPLVGKAAK